MPTMKANTGPKFVSLKRESPKTSNQVRPSDGPSYPTLYVNKPISGLGEKEINEKIRAEVKIVLKRISRSETNGVKDISYDIEVQEIRIL